jgi:hypothetical protein
MDPQQLSAFIDQAIAANPELAPELEAFRSTGTVSPRIMGVLQPLEAQFRDARTQQGIGTDATSANVFGSNGWRDWTGGGQGWDADELPQQQPQEPTAYAPATRGPSISSLVGGNPAPSQFTDQFSFDPAKVAESPSYKFGISELVRNVPRMASARGLTFTNAPIEEFGQRAAGLLSGELNNEFGRQLDTFGTNYGTFSDNWNRGRAGQLDDRAWDTEGFRREDVNRNFAANRADTSWNQNRTDVNDQWGRGQDLWSMGRTDKNDNFDQQYRLSDLILSRRPRPQ